MNDTPRLVLFDIDGTLLHSGGAGRDAMEGALVEVFGTAGDPGFRYDGKTDRQIVREQMHDAGFAPDVVEREMDTVIAAYLRRLRTRLQDPVRRVTPCPGVMELIDAIESRPDMVLGLLTGNVEPGARLKLAAGGMDIRRFAVSAFGSDHEVRGELPAIAHARMRDTFGVTLRGTDVFVIGDTPADVQCGRALGARAIGVATGRYPVHALREHDPYATFEDLSDTRAVLAAITGEAELAA